MYSATGLLTLFNRIFFLMIDTKTLQTQDVAKKSTERHANLFIFSFQL